MLQGPLALAVGLLAACGMLDTTRKVEKPPVSLVSSNGSTVRVNDDQTGSPVEMRTGQELVVRLHFEGATAATWTLVDFKPGVLSPIGESRFEMSPDSGKYGPLTGDQVWRFKSVEAGQMALSFEFRAPHSRDGAIHTASYSVTVH